MGCLQGIEIEFEQAVTIYRNLFFLHFYLLLRLSPRRRHQPHGPGVGQTHLQIVYAIQIKFHFGILALGFYEKSNQFCGFRMQVSSA